MSYNLNVKLKDVRYDYSGCPHSDEEYEISVWNDGVKIPIGDIAKIVHDTDGSAQDKQDAIAAKYGSNFAKTFVNAFSVFEEFDDEVMESIDADQNVYSRLSMCNPLITEYVRREMEGHDIVVEDIRSEESKKISQDLFKLCYDVGDDLIKEELSSRETSGKLTKAVVVHALCEMYEVCKDAAVWYVDTYCEYKYKDDNCE